jgi:hypothetical protein
VSCICKLKPLTLEELREYLEHRLTLAGLPRQTLFTEETIQLIFEYSKGIPRLINSLCNAALQTGFAMQSPEITISIIEEVARDLELRVSVPEVPAASTNAIVAKPAKAALSVLPRPSAVNDAAVDGRSEDRMPLESYASRQKSLRFFVNLMDRWK